MFLSCFNSALCTCSFNTIICYFFFFCACISTLSGNQHACYPPEGVLQDRKIDRLHYSSHTFCSCLPSCTQNVHLACLDSDRIVPEIRDFSNMIVKIWGYFPFYIIWELYCVFHQDLWPYGDWCFPGAFQHHLLGHWEASRLLQCCRFRITKSWVQIPLEVELIKLMTVQGFIA